MSRPVTAAPALSKRSRHRAFLSLAARLAGSVAVLLLLFHFLPVSQVGATLRRLPAGLWTFCLLAYLAAHLVGVAKWRLMVNLAGSGLNYPQAARCYFAGLFATLFLPSIVGGDVVRATLALRMGRTKAGVLLGSFFDRLLDLAALALIAAFGATLLPGTVPPASRRIFLGIAALFVLLAAVLTGIAVIFPARKFSYRVRRKLVRLRRAARSMAQQPLRVTAALSLGISVQSSFVALTALLAAASGLHLVFRAWLFAWPLAKLSAVLPLTQGGIGVREAALVALLVPFGARPVLTVAVALAWEAIIITGGLAAGLGSFLASRFGAHAVSRSHQLL